MRATGPAARRLRLLILLAIRLSLLLLRPDSSRPDGPELDRRLLPGTEKPRGTGAVRGRFVADTRPAARAGRCRSSPQRGSGLSCRSWSPLREPAWAGPLHALFPGGPPLHLEPHGSPSRCLPCRSCTSSVVVRPRVALSARFDACRGERCSLPRVRVIRAGVPVERSVPVSLLPGVGDTGETHCLRGEGYAGPVHGKSSGAHMEVQKVHRRSRIGPHPRARLAQASAAGRLAVRPAPSGNGRFPQVCTPFGPNLDRNCPRIIVIWIFLIRLFRVQVISELTRRFRDSPAVLSCWRFSSRACRGQSTRSIRIYRCCDGSNDLAPADMNL